MRLKTINWIIVLLICLAPASANILEVDLTFDKKDKILSSDVKISEGLPSLEYNESGDYRLEILDVTEDVLFSNTYNIKFLILATKGKIGESTTLNAKIDYNEDMYELRLYNKDKIIFQKFLDFCDNNNICDMNENALTCSTDCPLDKRDNICIPSENKICDPDCMEGIDPDCKIQEMFNKVLELAILLLILALIIAFVNERKKFRKFLEIKNTRYYQYIVAKWIEIKTRFIKAIESFK